MILDALTCLADGLAVTDSDAVTTYSYDLGNVTPKRDPGNGTGLALVFTVDVTASVSTDQFDFEVIMSDAETLDSNIVSLSKMRVAGALLTAGTVIVLPVPPYVAPVRYLGGRITLGTSSTITVSCNVVPLTDVQNSKIYADAITWEA